MTRFTTDHLKTFVTVIEYGTFDAAADILGVSPSAISQRVKTMEQLAGKVLLQRTNPVTPTASGQSVLRIARQSEFLQLELERELMGEGGFQTVSIALNADSLATWFWKLYARSLRRTKFSVTCGVKANFIPQPFCVPGKLWLP